MLAVGGEPGRAYELVAVGAQLRRRAAAPRRALGRGDRASSRPACASIRGTRRSSTTSPAPSRWRAAPSRRSTHLQEAIRAQPAVPRERAHGSGLRADPPRARLSRVVGIVDEAVRMAELVATALTSDGYDGRLHAREPVGDRPLLRRADAQGRPAPLGPAREGHEPAAVLDRRLRRRGRSAATSAARGRATTPIPRPSSTSRSVSRTAASSGPCSARSSGCGTAPRTRSCAYAAALGVEVGPKPKR